MVSLPKVVSVQPLFIVKQQITNRHKNSHSNKIDFHTNFMEIHCQKKFNGKKNCFTAESNLFNIYYIVKSKSLA